MPLYSLTEEQQELYTWEVSLNDFFFCRMQYLDWIFHGGFVFIPNAFNLAGSERIDRKWNAP